jgi:hypothetical protein
LFELKSVAKIMLAPGERRTIGLPVPSSAFAFARAKDFRQAVEPGRFELSAGLSADRANLLTISIDAIAD